MDDLKFNQENVYWYKRALAFFSRDKLRERYSIFLGLTKSYSYLQDHEMVLDSGKKALEAQSLFAEAFDLEDADE